MVQLPHPFMTAEKTTTLTIQIFVGKDCFFKDSIFKDSHIQRYWGLGLQYMGLGSQGGRFQPSTVIHNVTLPNSHGLVTLNSFSINIRRFLSHSLNMCCWTWASMQGDKYSSSCSDAKQRHVQLNSHLRKPEWTGDAPFKMYQLTNKWELCFDENLELTHCVLSWIPFLATRREKEILEKWLGRWPSKPSCQLHTVRSKPQLESVQGWTAVRRPDPATLVTAPST